jgi:hypothetical protein
MYLVILILVCPLAFGQKIVAARAGVVYYAEGLFQVDGKTARAQNRPPQLQDGQVASSPKGHAELLLGPNAVLWTGTQAKVRFDDTRVESASITVLEGAAILELSRTLDLSRIHVRVGSLEVELHRDGVYRFDAAAQSMRVYAGEVLLPGALRAVRGQEVISGSTKAFDRKDLDEFHYWCAYRSFLLESDAGAYRQWSRKSWGEHEHSGFGIKFPDAKGAARVKYLAASEAGLVYSLEGSAVTGAQKGATPPRLPILLGRDNFLRTDAGKAEMFLGVGVVARIADNSSLRMIDTRASGPVVALEEGTLLVEVADSAEGAPLRVRVGDSMTELLKAGVYEFDATAGSLSVYGGESSTAVAGTVTRAKEAQRVNLQQPAPLGRFDLKAQDALFKWSARRSFVLLLSPAAFMTPWEQLQSGKWKHKQFGERIDPQRPAPRRPRYW